MLLTTLLLIAAPPAGADPVPGREKLDAARAAYATEAEKAKTAFVEALKAGAAQFIRAGKFTEGNLLTAEIKTFELEGKLPVSAFAAKPVAAYSDALTAIGSTLKAAYVAAIRGTDDAAAKDRFGRELAEFERTGKLPKPILGVLGAGGRFEYRSFTWTNGNPPTRMIHRDEGFCYLTSIHGGFAGGGEAAYVRLEKDGYWYLSGVTQKRLLQLEAVAVVVRE